MAPVMVLDDWSTIGLIVSTKCSFARLGDGEYRIVEGRGTKTQPKDPVLAGRLRHILQSQEPQVLVGILDLYSGKPVAMPWRSRKRVTARYGSQEWAQKYLLPGKIYGCASVTRLCNWALGDRAAWWAKVAEIWQGRDVLLVTGSGKGEKALDMIRPKARSVAQLRLSRPVNAFADYASILSYCRHWAAGEWESTLVMAALGATATVLAYDLGRLGIQALDIGHMAQSWHGVEPKGLPES